MRKLPRNMSPEKLLILKATEDFFGQTYQKNKSISKVALFIMGRKRNLEELTEEEKDAVFYVKNNLLDKTYKDTFEALNFAK